MTDLIDLEVTVDGILQLQAARDTRYFLEVCGQSFYEEFKLLLGELMLEAYRYQYLLSGTRLPRFQGILADLLLPQQLQRIGAAMETLQPAREWPGIPQAVNY